LFQVILADIKTVVLYMDKIDGLMKSIKLMQEKVKLTVPTEYTEVSLKSIGGFEAGCFVRLVVRSKLVNYLIK